jgi:hypothetical protein
MDSVLDDRVVLLKESTRKLSALLDDPHPGLHTWIVAVTRQIAAINAIADGEHDAAEDTPDEQRLRDQLCPQCERKFELCWNDYSDRKQTLFMRGCPSGGIYDVSIHCPHCNYQEEL